MKRFHKFKPGQEFQFKYEKDLIDYIGKKCNQDQVKVAFRLVDDGMHDYYTSAPRFEIVHKTVHTGELIRINLAKLEPVKNSCRNKEIYRISDKNQ